MHMHIRMYIGIPIIATKLRMTVSFQSINPSI